MTARLLLTLSDLQRIEAHAMAALPRESCGVILGTKTGTEWRALAIEDSPNIAPGECNDSFEIDPALLLRLQKASRMGSPRMIGVYHSHPNGVAAPSRTDLAQSWQNDFLWLITAVEPGRSQTRAYLREAGGFTPVALQVQDEVA